MSVGGVVDVGACVGEKSCDERWLAFFTAATKSAVKVCFILDNRSSVFTGGEGGGWLGGDAVGVGGSD